MPDSCAVSYPVKKGPQRDIVLMNTAAALTVGDKVTTFGQGIEYGRRGNRQRKSAAKVEELIKFSQNAG